MGLKMILGLHGFPVLEELNQARSELFDTSHKKKEQQAVKFTSWLGHKALTVVSLPANLAGVGLGAAGMAVTASTLGVLKVAIYAMSLGNVKPSFPTGFIWSAERGINAGAHFAMNLGEVIYDAGNTVYLGYRFIRWVGEKLHIERFIAEIFRKLGELFEYIGEQLLAPALRFVARRLEKGFEKAVEREGNFKFSGATPSLICPLDDLTKKNRIDWNEENRPLSKIFHHYVLSAFNIPVNAVTAACAGGASVILSSAFTAKVILYATTNINIPLPTFAGQALDATFATTRNAVVDAGTDVADSFVLLYKASSALGITRVVATALQVLRYIPEAIFS
jgi:hypothetical protein